MSSVEIGAQLREEKGTRQVKKMRTEGLVPGVIYRDGKDATHVAFETKKLSHFISHAHGLVTLSIEGQKESFQCILKDIQYHPVTDKILHVDFQGVTIGRKIRIAVPITLLGEPKGVKLGGVLQQSLRELKVECTPENLPKRVEIKIGHLEVGKSIQVKDLKIDNVRFLNAQTESIVSVELTRAAQSLGGEVGEAVAEGDEVEKAT